MKNKNKPQTTGLKVTGKNNVFVDCGFEGFGKGIELGETAEGNKFVAADVKAAALQNTSKWYEKFIGKIIVGVIIGLIVLAATLLVNKYFISTTPQQELQLQRQEQPKR